MIKKTNKRLTITIPKQNYDYVNEMSKTRGKSKSKIIEEIIMVFALLFTAEDALKMIPKEVIEEIKKNEER